MAYTQQEKTSHSLLRKLGAMTALREMQRLERNLLQTLTPMLGVPAASLYRTDEHGVITKALHRTRTLASEGGEVQRVVERVEEVHSHIVLPAHLDQLIGSMRLLQRGCSYRHGKRYVIGRPFHTCGAVRGYFIFEREHEATPDEDALIAGVLEVFANYAALLDTSQRDRLTGLPNRYALELGLEQLWDLLAGSPPEAQAGQEPPRQVRRDAAADTYWLGVLDIDHFKRINDVHGHVIGDEVLLLVARLLSASLRRGDMLYRYGGEEFVAIVAADDALAASQVFDRAREALAAFDFPQVGKVTISGGYSKADPAVLPQSIINRADRALYEAKNAGRNRMLHYDDLIGHGLLQEIAMGSIELF